MSRSSTVTSGGVDLHVRSAGPAGGVDPSGGGPGGGSGGASAQGVLLLHGWPDSSLMWSHQVAALAGAGHRVIAPDLRGFGLSERPRGRAAYTLDLLVADALAVVDDAGLERVTVVGHDWGAVVAWALAAAAPERVRATVALSVGHPSAFTAGGLAQARRSWYFAAFVVPGIAERMLPARGWAFLRAAWGGADPAATPGLARQIADLERPGAITASVNLYRANVPSMLAARRRPPRRVAGPAMGVWSTGDTALTRAQMESSGRFVDGGWRFEVLEGAGHWIAEDAPGPLSGLLLDFVGPAPR